MKPLSKHVEKTFNHRGGFTALQANYYTFLHVMRLAVSGVIGMKIKDKYRESFIDNKDTISRKWDGIGEWRH